MVRILTTLLLGLVIGLMANVAIAQDKTHEGTVVSASEGKLVMTDKDGKNEHTHMITDAAKVTLDGKAAKVTDLHKGDHVKVTTDGGGKVSSVAATRSSK